MIFSAKARLILFDRNRSIIAGIFFRRNIISERNNPGVKILLLKVLPIESLLINFYYVNMMIIMVYHGVNLSIIYCRGTGKLFAGQILKFFENRLDILRHLSMLQLRE